MTRMNHVPLTSTASTSCNHKFLDVYNVLWQSHADCGLHAKGNCLSYCLLMSLPTVYPIITQDQMSYWFDSSGWSGLT